MNVDLKAYFPALSASMLPLLAETLLLAAAADGELGHEERVAVTATLAAVVRGTEHESLATGPGLESLLRGAEAMIQTEGRHARLSALKTAMPERLSRLGALGLAVSVVAADGIVRTSERELLLEFADALDIDRDEAADLVIRVARGG